MLEEFRVIASLFIWRHTTTVPYEWGGRNSRECTAGQRSEHFSNVTNIIEVEDYQMLSNVDVLLTQIRFMQVSQNVAFSLVHDCYYHKVILATSHNNSLLQIEHKIIVPVSFTWFFGQNISRIFICKL